MNHEYARYVLTCDRLFSFEQGSAAVSIFLAVHARQTFGTQKSARVQIMNLQPIMALTGGTLFRDLQDFVRDGIVDRIDEIVDRSEPSYFHQSISAPTDVSACDSMASLSARHKRVCQLGRRGSQDWQTSELL